MDRSISSGSSADSVLENTVKALRTLVIDKKKSISLERRPVFYVWSSRGKCAPYAVPKKLCRADPVDNLYSAMSGVYIHGNFDVTMLRHQLLRSPMKMEFSHRRRDIRLRSYWWPLYNDR
ncbi:hypothetical protein NECAME_02234 [Necator americanus]|uniref:Uncharacterized protein n=1 Tax=Necator americanus TaxID=51031 RepID=W2TJ48_NECAM|nr:hypothetical protein NECAME_02234 [Necator americanus]ETN81191.1 hypothetical protein NECAME_02234 [Necator americanus]